MRTVKKGATSQSLYFDVLDSTSTTGGRKTGLAYNTSSLVAYYVRNGGSATAITLATLAAANSSWSSGGFKEVDATNMPGIYRLDVPDAAFASGAESVVVTIRGASGMVQASYDVQLVDNTAGDVFSRLGAPVGASISADIAGVQADTDNIQTRLPAALVSGRIDASVGAMANDVITNSAIATDAIGSAELAASAASEIGTAVWAATTRELTSGANIALAKGTGITGFNDLSAAQVNAEADTALSDAGVTSVRMAHLDADVSSRMATFSYTAPDNASITAIKDKTDNLPSDPASDSNVFFAASEVMSHGDAAWLTASGFSTSADITGAVSTIEGYGDVHWATAMGFSTYDGSDTAGTTTLLSRLTATRAGYLDNLSAGAVATAEAVAALPQAVWDVLTSALITVGSVGKLLVDNIDAAISTRLASSGYTAPNNAGITAIQAVTDALPDAGALTSLAQASTLGTPAGGSIAADIAAVPTASENASAVLAVTYEGSETVQDHLRLARAALVGKANGLATTTAHYRDAADTKNRITATVDADGNRSAVTTDAT